VLNFFFFCFFFSHTIKKKISACFACGLWCGSQCTGDTRWCFIHVGWYEKKTCFLQSRVLCSPCSIIVLHQPIVGANWALAATENQSRPVRTDVVEHVLDVACGTQHTLAITQGARCFAWGSGCHGQLGIGVIDTPVKRPVLVAKLSVLKCRQVSCGGLHSAALSCRRPRVLRSAGAAWVSSASSPMRCKRSQLMVEMPCAVVKVVCGWNHTLALSSTGECYAWGAGTHGQTASPSRQHRRQPRVVQVTDDADVPLPEAQVIVDIDAGARHSVMLTSSGDVYAYGCAEDGELGAGVEVMESASISGAGPVRPVRALYDKAAADGASLKLIASGAWHNVAVNNNGQAYSWGYGADFRLGHGDKLEQPAPRHIAAFGPLRIDYVAAGGAHTMFVAKVKPH
jgi:alpha-tubulin suppressor-like RCC1 family protein